MFEVSHGLVHLRHAGEGPRKLAEDLLKADDLVAIHHTNQQVPRLFRVHAPRRQHGDAVMQLLQQTAARASACLVTTSNFSAFLPPLRMLSLMRELR